MSIAPTVGVESHVLDPLPDVPTGSVATGPAPAANRAQRFVRVLRSPLGIAAVIGLVVLTFFTIFGPIIWGQEATVADLTQLSAKPSPEHPLGTDAGGRDVLARVLTATRLSVMMALAATAIGVIFGVGVGFLPNVLPRRGARFVVSATGIALAFPALLLMIVLSIVVGTGAVGAVLAIGFAMVPFYGRLAQTLSASIAGRDFVAAARILGVGRFTILRRHILPNVSEPLIVNASISAGGALIAFAGLSFLGLGVQAPEFDWGRMLNEGLSKIYVNPATALAPGAAVVFAGLVFTLVGESLARGFGLDSLVGRRPKRGARSAEPVTDAADTELVLRVRELRVGVPTNGTWSYPVGGVSFDVARGEIVGIVGESGSGKSLTCMSVAGLIDDPLVVTAGSVVFDGRELVRGGVVPTSVPSRELAGHLGTRMAFVFQDPSTSLNPALHVGPQVAEIGILHENLSAKEAKARAVDRLGAVRIADPERRYRQYPHEYSGGMRQRAMIAMGLMGDPALIIADEPTTALDVTVQREVLALLHAVNRKNQAAILFVSHDIAVVSALCDRVLVMYRGMIVEDIAVTALVAGEARHPYTRALLEAVPDMTGEPGAKFATIPEGTVFPTDAVEALS
ncbi:dipeptide/oligopeptide/nickel ABC transporter permease/ATP-binding protein [Microbacterium sp. Root61]|uniref:dipeptide/oligopeptide/nickel ABC transporter permease/ATP-binding protein n=1 Tax=Microbacterium sp. Root61 TaxID=1736570 RepID=UPI0009EAA65A|nr:dipeptide/oligopeptide/nickel ABC transporter permease/ATP-binding protein [Microbacterium sp. Root61]